MRDRVLGILYSRQRGYRSLSFLLVGLISVGAYAGVVRVPDRSVPGWVLAARREAVDRAVRAQAVIRAARQAQGLPINPGDRFGTGLIGVASSPLTTELGELASKRTSTNPVFAAALVQMLYEAGVRPGDAVAIGMSGSFPAFDVDAYVASEAMGATPLVISSVGASQYGANEKSLDWFDMEKALYEAGVIHHRSIAVGPGGNLTGKAYAVRRHLAQVSGLPLLPVLPSTADVNYRVRLYQRSARAIHRPLTVFVDVGGASANVGPSASESIIRPGLSRPRWSPYQASRLGVLGQMALHHVPVIAMFDVLRISRLFHLQWDPIIQPTARDLPAPPPEPLLLLLTLVALVTIVLLVHRRGLFRVPNWELPPGLRKAMRRPGPAPEIAMSAPRPKEPV